MSSVRRELPSRSDLESENPWQWTALQRDVRTVARFTFASEPSVLEVRGNELDRQRSIELRVKDHGAWRVVSDTLRVYPPPMLD